MIWYIFDKNLVAIELIDEMTLEEP